MLLRIFLPLLLPLGAVAQTCDCCKVRTLGQQKYDAGDYTGAKTTWETAKKMKDAAKCKDLDGLIAEAKKKIPPPEIKTPAKKNTQPPPKPNPAAETDELAWKYAQGTLLGCQRYLADHPNGKYVQEARQCEKDYSDSDGDGVINKEDRCPSEKGALADKGCPPLPVVTAPSAEATKQKTAALIPSPVRHGKKSGLAMIQIEGGALLLGSPENEPDRESDECQHRETVGHFAMGQYEVTQADWVEVMGSNPSRFNNCDECPVEQVSWDDAQAFIKAANQKYGRNFRLPTEAEWEYAARGGKKSAGYRYAGSNTLGEVAWCYENSGSSTHVVGGKKANEAGLYDMSGNVWEWCADEYGPYPGCAEPKEQEANSRVLRGGSWNLNGRICRVTYRNWITPGRRDKYVGFRVSQD